MLPPSPDGRTMLHMKNTTATAHPIDHKCSICGKARGTHRSFAPLGQWKWSAKLGTHVAMDGKHHGFLMRREDYSGDGTSELDRLIAQYGR